MCAYANADILRPLFHGHNGINWNKVVAVCLEHVNKCLFISQHF